MNPPSYLDAVPTEALYEALRPVTIPPSSKYARFTNWSGTFSCSPLAVFEPESEHQCRLILELARREGKVVRAVGVGHSPSDLACTTGFMLRTTKLDRVLEINVDKQYVIAEAGITLEALHDHLAQHGLAMINVGSISDQTLGGIVTTATHGTGINYGVISTNVMALTLLLADGSHIFCSRTERSDLFVASICGLGSTGLILNVTLQVEPAFRLREVREMHSFHDAIRQLHSFIHASQHVRLWWYPTADRVRVSSADRTAEPCKSVGNWFWDSFLAYHVTLFLLFVSRYVPLLVIFVGRFAAWLTSGYVVAIDTSHRIFNLECGFPQRTTEWAIPYENTQACLEDLHTWLKQEVDDPRGLRPHFPIEIRFSDSDDIWLSPSSGRKTCWIGIVQYKPYGFNVPYRKLFAHFEAILGQHGGRPHWAKAHGLRPDALRRLYPHFDDFVRVLQEVDPKGMFRNEYVQRHIFGREEKEFDGRVFKRYKPSQRM